LTPFYKLREKLSLEREDTPQIFLSMEWLKKVEKVREVVERRASSGI